MNGDWAVSPSNMDDLPEQKLPLARICSSRSCKGTIISKIQTYITPSLQFNVICHLLRCFRQHLWFYAKPQWPSNHINHSQSKGFLANLYLVTQLFHICFIPTHKPRKRLISALQLYTLPPGLKVFGKIWVSIHLASILTLDLHPSPRLVDQPPGCVGVSSLNFPRILKTLR